MGWVGHATLWRDEKLPTKIWTENLKKKLLEDLWVYGGDNANLDRN